MAAKMHIQLINRGEEGELLLEGRLDSAARFLRPLLGRTIVGVRQFIG